MRSFGDAHVEMLDHVAVVEIRRPPHNYFDPALIGGLVDAFRALQDDVSCRAIVLAAQGKSFCAGADFSGSLDLFDENSAYTGKDLYHHAAQLFGCSKPVVGAVQGNAIGGGLGLALVPDFRVVSPETRFSANFVKLGIHPGFGLTHTLPRLIGGQKAALMFQTGRRIGGEQAVAWGLADILTGGDRLRETALELANEIAENAPLAVQSTRETLRIGLVEAVKKQTEREFSEQSRLVKTEDHQEGVRAVAERRPGNFAAR